MILPAFVSLWLAVPVLLVGELMVRRVRWLNHYNIPAPVVGGFFIALLILSLNLAVGGGYGFKTTTNTQWWTWIVLIEPKWLEAPQVNVILPLMSAFFACVGLNGSWLLLKRDSVFVALFALLAGVLSVMQNVVGLSLAKLLGVSPLLGLVCGSMTLTGGHGTGMGFAPLLEELGLNGAATLTMAAATFGLVSGGLIGGPVGGYLIRRNKLASERVVSSRENRVVANQSEIACANGNATTAVLPPETTTELVADSAPRGFLAECRALIALGKPAITHLFIILLCIKIGVWITHFIQKTGLIFAVQIGAMLAGVIVRNISDLFGAKWVKTDVVDAWGAAFLGVFLAAAMMSLNLIELAGTAVSMLLILAGQVTFMAIFALTLTFWVMGRNYDAAVIAGGHCGFGLGATPNAVANMKSLTDRFGPSPRAFLAVPIVGAFLMDLMNAVNISVFLNWVK